MACSQPLELKFLSACDAEWSPEPSRIRFAVAQLAWDGKEARTTVIAGAEQLAPLANQEPGQGRAGDSGRGGAAAKAFKVSGLAVRKPSRRGRRLKSSRLETSEPPIKDDDCAKTDEVSCQDLVTLVSFFKEDIHPRSKLLRRQWHLFCKGASPLDPTKHSNVTLLHFLDFAGLVLVDRHVQDLGEEVHHLKRQRNQLLYIFKVSYKS